MGHPTPSSQLQGLGAEPRVVAGARQVTQGLVGGAVQVARVASTGHPEREVSLDF